MKPFSIDPDIRKASTLPAEFYRNPNFFEETKEKIFAATWQYAADARFVKGAEQIYPFVLLEKALDEPLVLTRHSDRTLFCLSNVCTHRGKLIVEKPGNSPMLRCGYHGRCFRLDGTFKSMPEFSETIDFPTPADDLTKVAVEEWLGLLFVSLHPRMNFEEVIHPIQERVRFLPLDTLEFIQEESRDYFVNAHWALYCDNYLEGFHVPLVHPALNEALDVKKYDYELFPFGNLQIGIAEEGEPHFALPENSPDFGRKIYAYYFWLFPNLMLNFYPWGLSLNVVEPLNPRQSKVRFRTYRFKNTPYAREINQIDLTEQEDEAVVESVQLGIHSGFYKRGRFSPSMEKCVHHFHLLVDDFLS